MYDLSSPKIFQAWWLLQELPGHGCGGVLPSGLTLESDAFHPAAGVLPLWKPWEVGELVMARKMIIFHHLSMDVDGNF